MPPAASTSTASRSDSMPMLPSAVTAKLPLFLLVILLWETITGMVPATVEPPEEAAMATFTSTVTSFASAWERTFLPAVRTALFVFTPTLRLNTFTLTVAPTATPVPVEPEAAMMPLAITLLDLASTFTLSFTEMTFAPSRRSTNVSDLVMSTPSEPATALPEPPVAAEAEAMMEIRRSLSMAVTLASPPLAVSSAPAPTTASVRALLTVTSTVPPTAALPPADDTLREISSRSSSVFAFTSSLPPATMRALSPTSATALLLATITLIAPPTLLLSWPVATAAATVNSWMSESTVAFWV